MIPTWILLIHQIPPEPGYLRVKIRRRLRRIGSTALKNTVYVLPAGDDAREAFEWVAREIRAGGGEAILCEARFVGGLVEEEVRDLFREERAVEYREIVRIVEEIGAVSGSDGQAGRLTFARRRLANAIKLDFFDAPGRAAAEHALAQTEARMRGEPVPLHGGPLSLLDALRGRVWVTRRGVHVDRMASAWLIRRFIDRDATFRFVDSRQYQPVPGELRFDMYEGEFTHAGDLCTFEVLTALVAPDDSALREIAEIVHEIDLCDDKFKRPEVAGVERMIAGVQALHPDDSKRIDHIAELFESLYRGFGGEGVTDHDHGRAER